LFDKDNERRIDMDHGIGSASAPNMQMHKARRSTHMRSAVGPAIFPRCLARRGRRGWCVLHHPRSHVQPSLRVQPKQTRAGPTVVCRSDASAALLAILIEAGVRACPGVDATTFWTTHDIPFEPGTLELGSCARGGRMAEGRRAQYVIAKVVRAPGGALGRVSAALQEGAQCESGCLVNDPRGQQARHGDTSL
jgi:hypothetical protein